VSATTTPYPHDMVIIRREPGLARMELQHGLLDDCFAGVRDRRPAGKPAAGARPDRQYRRCTAVR
jgi:hypothetical protein